MEEQNCSVVFHNHRGGRGVGLGGGPRRVVAVTPEKENAKGKFAWPKKLCVLLESMCLLGKAMRGQEI